MEINRLTAAREERRRRGHDILDLTVTNPTTAGIPYPLDELEDVMGRAARHSYDPQPFGIRAAREAVASEHDCDPDDVIITASTSEAYSFLFKCLTSPGDDVATAVPAYPLLEQLAAMEHVALRAIPLEFHRRWELTDFEPGPRTQAIALVSPNNPTGSFIEAADMRITARHHLPILLDEVFKEYVLDGGEPAAPPGDVLAFRLGGLSKSCGLPHYKLAWMIASGPAGQKVQALKELELIADNLLSVATPVQQALPDLFRLGAGIRKAIHERTRTNLGIVRGALAEHRSVEVLRVEGGWSAVLRIPITRTDEETALALLDEDVFVQPGYFYDIPSDGFLVVSLLTQTDILTEGMARLAAVVAR
jgi:alanine-synthesizing transaminase